MSDLGNILFWLGVVSSLACLGYALRRYAAALRNRPNITKDDIVYEERFASGSSLRNVVTRIGGARSCLRIVVTGDLLWITSWFPFTLFAAVYDLEHVIPLRSISSIRPTRFFGADSLVLSYTDAAGRSHSLRLTPRNRERLLAVLRPSETNVA